MGNDGVDERLDNQGRRRFLTATTAVVGAVGVGFAGGSLHQVLEAERARQAGRRPGHRRHQRAGRRHAHGARVARPADLDRQAHASRCWTSLPTLDPRLRDPKSDNADQQPAYAKNELALDQAGDLRARRHLHAPGLLAGVEGRDQARAVRPGTGRAASSAPATSRASTWPAACSRACPRRSTCWCRRTTYESDTTIVIGVDPKGARKPWRM